MAKESKGFFDDTNKEELTGGTPMEPIEAEAEGKVVYQGRRERRNSLFDSLNKLNAKDKEWKYTLGERFKNEEGYDGVDRLLEDGYTVLPNTEAKKILGVDLRGHHVLMRIERDQHNIYVAEAIAEATGRAEVKAPEGNAVVKMTEAKTERRLVSISGT